MQAASRAKLFELQTVISRMPLEVCFALVPAEFGVRCRDVSRAVRAARQPMAPASVARVLCRHAARSLAHDEVEDILARLRLKLIATKERRWHVIKLLEPVDEDISVAHLIRALPSRVAQELRKTRAGRSMRPEVQTVKMGDLVYMSVQMVSDTKSSSILYVAVPPGEPVALVSSINSSMLKPCVQGLGYGNFEDSRLFGHDIRSLLQIHERAYSGNVDHLVALPRYNPTPVVTGTGVDFTNNAYNERYVDDVIGPDAPLLTELLITSQKPFFDPTRLDKPIRLFVQLKCSDVADTLRTWVKRGALSPTSEMLHVLHKVRSNRLEYVEEES